MSKSWKDIKNKATNFAEDSRNWFNARVEDAQEYLKGRGKVDFKALVKKVGNLVEDAHNYFKNDAKGDLKEFENKLKDFLKDSEDYFKTDIKDDFKEFSNKIKEISSDIEDYFKTDAKGDLRELGNKLESFWQHSKAWVQNAANCLEGQASECHYDAAQETEVSGETTSTTDGDL